MTTRSSDSSTSSWEGFQYATPRTPERPTRGHIVANIAAKLGTPFMPAQRHIVDVAMEYDPDTGLPFYREVRITLPRQSGKTTILLPTELERAVCRGRPQHITYSAQTGKDAVEKLLEEQWPMLERSPLRPLVKGEPVRKNGSEKIRFKTGSLLDILAGTTKSGHGPKRHLCVADEAFADTDSRRQDAFLPSMATVDDAQFFLATTAGTDESRWWNRKLETGRLMAAKGRTHGVAFFEASLPPGADPFSPDAWRRFHPALGHTISLATIQHALTDAQEIEDPEERDRALAEFIRSWCNITQRGTSMRLIPELVWQAVVSATATAVTPVTWGLDILPDRSWASIGVAGGGVVELVKRDRGVGWVVERLVELQRAYGGPIVLDGGGPAATEIPDLEAAGLDLHICGGAEAAAACMSFYDDIADRNVTVRRDPAMDDAAAGVAKKPFGDRWAYARTTSTGDITPLYAVTLAHWGAAAAAKTTTYEDWAEALGLNDGEAA